MSVILLAIAPAIVVGYPIARAMIDIASSIACDDDAFALTLSASAWRGLFNTIWIAALIAIVATTLGGIAGAALGRARRGRAVASLALAATLLAPSYLAYSSYGVLRGPGSWTGDWLARTAEQGAEWLPPFVWRILAIGGVALWLAPLATAVVAIGVARVPRALADLAQTPAYRRGRLKRWIGLHRATLLTSLCLTAAIAAGSAIPLHLGQVETQSIVLWREQSLLLPERWHRAWLGAIPVCVVIAGLLLLAIRFGRGLASPQGTGARTDTPKPTAWLGPLAVIALTLLIPLGLLAWSVRDWSIAETVWRVTRRSLRSSAVIAAWTGGGAIVLAALSALAAWSRARIPLVIAAVLFAIGFALPGTITGSVMATAWRPLRFISDTPAIVVLTHLARFGVIAVAAGWWVVRREPPDLVDQRRLQDAEHLRGWVRLGLPRQWGILAAAGAVCAALSLHEIEAAVLVQPPGPGSLAQQLLGNLHYQRLDELAIAVLMVTGLGIALAAIAWGLTRAIGNRDS